MQSHSSIDGGYQMISVPAIKPRQKPDRSLGHQPETQPSPSPYSTPRASYFPVSTGTSSSGCDVCAAATMAKPCAIHQREVFNMPEIVDAQSLLDFLGDNGEMLIAGSEKFFDSLDVITEDQLESIQRDALASELSGAVSSAASSSSGRKGRAKRQASDFGYGATDSDQEGDDDDDEAYVEQAKLSRARGGGKKKKMKKTCVKRELTSKYHGVCWYKRTQRWVCQIKVNGSRKHIGYFTNEDAAGMAYNKVLSCLVNAQEARTVEGGAAKARKRTFNNTPKRFKSD